MTPLRPPGPSTARTGIPAALRASLAVSLTRIGTLAGIRCAGCRALGVAVSVLPYPTPEQFAKVEHVEDCAGAIAWPAYVEVLTSAEGGR